MVESCRVSRVEFFCKEFNGGELVPPPNNPLILQLIYTKKTKLQ